MTLVAKRKSSGVSKRDDARARRTRERLDRAFVELLHRRAYDGLRVADIARKSGVGRATFYAHHASKDALLRSQLDRIVIPTLRAAPGEPCVIDATAFFEHTRAVAPLYHSLVSGRGRRIVEESLEAHVTRIVGRESLPPSLAAIDPSIVARFVASSLLGLVTWWVEGRHEGTAARMQATFATLCGGRPG